MSREHSKMSLRVPSRARLVKRTQERERDWVLSLVSHELRSPLSAIMLAARALHDTPTSDAAIEMSRIILRSAHRMDGLIRNMLDIAQSRFGGGVPLAPSAVNAHEVCLSAIGELRTAHPGRELRLVAEGDGLGSWDRSRLEQIVSNLVLNALHHGAYESAITVRSRGDGARVAIAVHNFGAPIAPETRKHLFEAFARGNVRRRAGAQNLGLGLYIVRQIVEAHGGEISATSTATHGTCFEVRLPRAAGAVSPPAANE